MMSNLQPMISDRLIMRGIENEDADFIFKLRSDKEQWRYVESEPYRSIDRAERFIKNVLSDIGAGNVYFWVIQLKETMRPLGTICVWSFSEDGKNAEIGYELLSDAQGNGYALEAVKAVKEFAFEHLGLVTLHAITHEEHKASIQLLKRSGFTEQGYVKDLIPDAEDGPHMKLYKVYKE